MNEPPTTEDLYQFIGRQALAILRYREALERIRQGFTNILEFRHLDNGRFGNLTREEVEGVIAEVDKALAAGERDVQRTADDMRTL